MSTPTSDRTPAADSVSVTVETVPEIDCPVTIGPPESSDCRSVILDTRVAFPGDVPQIITARISRYGDVRLYELQGPEFGGSRSIPLSAEATRRLIEVYEPLLESMRQACAREERERDATPVKWY